jgi:hypothetical protein
MRCIGARALRLRDHLHDLREHGGRAHLVGPDHERAGAVERGADHPVALASSDRHGLAGEHGFVDAGTALHHGSIDRHLLAGPHAQAITDVHVVQGDVFLRPVVAEATRRLRRQPQQRLDGGGGLRACAKFEQLPEQRQRDDDGSGLEIHADPAMLAEGVREQARGDRRDDAVAVGRRHADPDQRPHVGAAVADRLQAAHEERPARPQHDGRAQRQLQPRAAVRRQAAQAVARHGKHQDDRSQRQRPPEATAEIAQLGVFVVIKARHFRLQRHAADGAYAGRGLAYLRVHRADVDRAGGSCRSHAGILRPCVTMTLCLQFTGRGSRRPLHKVCVRTGHETFAAARGADVVLRAKVHRVMRRARRVDAHAADRVDRQGLARSGRRMIVRRARHDGLGTGGWRGSTHAKRRPKSARGGLRDGSESEPVRNPLTL